MGYLLGLTESNQEIFDAYVRSMLHDCEVRLSDMPTDALLDSVDNDEASIDSALNLIVIAHAVYLFSEICTPIDKPAWANRLGMLRSRLADALPKCRAILGGSHIDVLRPDDSPDAGWKHFWHILVPSEYGMEPWREFNESKLLTSAKVAECPFLGDFRLMTPSPPNSLRPLAFERNLVEYSDMTSLTSWHYFVVSNRISELLERLEPPEFDEWVTAVDVCALLMSRAGRLGLEARDAMFEQPWSYTSADFRASPTTAEHWAWQFGRVSSLGAVRNNLDGITPVEYFDWHWPNGLTALSLMFTAKEPYDALVQSCWDGLMFANSGKGSAATFENGAAQPPSSYLHWLMRLGFLDGAKMIKEHISNPLAQSSNSSETSPLLLGSYQELGRAIVAAEQAAKQEHEADVAAKVADLLGRAWELLPSDSKQQLIEGELNLSSHKASAASLCYANAVENALEYCLPNIEGRRDWPQGIGKWENAVRMLTHSKDKRRHSALDHVLRKRFNPRYAKELADALGIFEKERLPGAHGKSLPPSAEKARATVLGIEQRPSVFEILLKFAMRTP